MCSKFENYTGFIVNSNIFESVQDLLVVDTNNYLDLYRAAQLLVSVVLGQPIPIMIFVYQLTTADTKKTSFSYRLNGIGWSIPKMACELIQKTFCIVVSYH
jgi:hypothetical protein